MNNTEKTSTGGLASLFNLLTGFAKTVGRLNTTLLLGVVFSLVFIPLGLIMRLTGRSPIKRGFKGPGSYWEHCELSGAKDRQRYERQF